MSFWIYNVGYGVPISEQQLSVARKPRALAELAITAKIAANDKQKNKNSIKISDDPRRQPPNQLASGYSQPPNEPRKKVLYADEIMSSPVIALSPNTNFQAGWQLFIAKRFRHFPVVSHDKKLLGIISDRDMLTELTKHNLNRQPPQMAKNIAQLMNIHVLTASPKTPIRELCRVMFSQHVGALPITDGQGQLLGIVTRSDILRTMIQYQPMELWV